MQLQTNTMKDAIEKVGDNVFHGNTIDDIFAQVVKINFRCISSNAHVQQVFDDPIIQKEFKSWCLDNDNLAKAGVDMW
jgi:hypothetical protein